jgi:hypothetical protein
MAAGACLAAAGAEIPGGDKEFEAHFGYRNDSAAEVLMRMGDRRAG